MTVSAERQKIWSIPTDRYLRKYGHPNGWTIVQDERDWNLGGITRGAQHQWSPKRWWEVQRRGDRNHRPVETFATLREARAWCDENKRVYGA